MIIVVQIMLIISVFYVGVVSVLGFIRAQRKFMMYKFIYFACIMHVF